jgi:hypothetical protein
MLLHLLAKSPLAAALGSYYAFPFLIALAWPLLAVLRQRQGREARPTGPVAGFAALLALTFMPTPDVHDPGRLPLPKAFLDSPSLAQQAATDHAVATVSMARPMLGRLLVDNSVAAIAPNAFTRAEIPFPLGQDSLPGDQANPDTVAFFADGYDAARLRAIADTAGLAWRYTVPGTPLHLAARQKLDGVRQLGRLTAE